MFVYRGVLAVMLLLTVSLVSAELLGSNSTDAEKDWERKVRGTKAANGSVPYQVSLRYRGVSHYCGASIVTPRVILTSAFCAGVTADRIKAVVGTNQLKSGGTAYRIRKIVRYEGYDVLSGGSKNDIGIMFTEDEIQFGSTVGAIELNDKPVEKGQDLLLTGWGTTVYPAYLPNDLMQLELQAVAYEECKEAHKNLNAVFETHICAKREGECHGESGGPLVREGKQVGIVSWGLICTRGRPGIFTKVEAFIPWIEQTLLEDDEDHLKYLHRNRKLPQQ